jgi:multidrug efflux pump subunit AcrB
MNLATWSIRNPIPSALMFALLTIAGLSGYYRLAVKDFPDLDFPTIQVALRLPGASPSQLETEVARRVEDSLASIEGLKHIRTQVSEGLVSMTVEFRIGRNLSDALIDVRDAVDKTRRDLPADLEPPIVNKLVLGPGGPIVSYAVTSDSMDEERLSWFIDDTVSRALVAVPGVGEFSRLGGVTREIQVQVDPARLNSLGISAADVSRALKHVQQEASGGRGQVGGEEQGLRTLATVRRAADLEALPVALADGRPVRLDQVATVRDTVADRTQTALLNGVPAVGFQIKRTKGYDDLHLAAGIERATEALAVAHPGLHFKRVSTTVTHTQLQFEGSMHMLYEGAILAMLVVWVFLRDWRATLLGAIALPLSIIPTFAVMYWAGFTLNGITLLALSVVIGILVDDAIVEIENIARHAQMGKSIREATIDAVTEIGLAVVATTMALVVVFLPTALMSGIPGLVFQQFGWTAVAAILASLLVARLMTPMMAVWLMRAPQAHQRADGWWMRNYLAAARWCLLHRRATLAGATLFFAASLALIPFIPTGFIAASDRGFTTLNVELPPGSNLESTVAVTEAVRRAIVGSPAPVPGIESVYALVGQAQPPSGVAGAGSAGEVRKATLTLTLADRGKRPPVGEIESRIRARLAAIPGARFSIGSGAPGEKLGLTLAGRDGAALKVAAEAIQTQLRTLPYLSSINSSASLERPEIIVRPDAARAAERGVTAQAIAETLRISTSGDFSAALAKLNLDDRQVNIAVRIPESFRTDLAALAGLRVPGRAGPVPLDSVASIVLGSGPSQIDRLDRRRNVTVSADLGGYSLGAAMKDVLALPAVKGLPSSVTWEGSGDLEFMEELFGGFGIALLTAILCVACVLVLLFKDFFQPLTILSAVPLSVGGAFVALLIGHSEVGLPALIGLIMLLGVVTKNSILLVDYAIMGMRDHGLTEFEALVEACHKRARPIVMTTVAMVAGMVPLALGIGGGDSSFRRPMAIAVIGGLITSTALSLLVVPAVYTYVAQAERAFRRRFGWGEVTQQAPQLATAAEAAAGGVPPAT